jgi:uncharacterized caspase-like protein
MFSCAASGSGFYGKGERMKKNDATTIRNDNAYALIIGISEYQNANIRKLNYTHADAQAFYDLLIDPQRAGFQKDNVRLLLDAAATRTQILKAVNQWLFSRVTPDSTLMIFFAGHGGEEQDKCDPETGRKAYYFLPWDADPEDMATTGVSQSDFQKLLRTLRSQRMVIFLDACHSTGVAKGGARDIATVAAPKYEAFAEGEGRVVIAAAKPEQCSWEDQKFQHGIFTYHLLEALRGKADTNGDGYVSIQEVAAYLQREVPRTVRLLGKEPQDPTFICESLTRDILLTVDAGRVHQRAQEQSAAEQQRLAEKQARRLKLVELRERNELPPKEFTEAMLINEKAAEEFTPTEKLLLEYLELLLADKISAPLYLETRARIYTETSHTRREDKRAPVKPPPLEPPVFCIHCGGRNGADNVFCFHCGKRLR